MNTKIKKISRALFFISLAFWAAASIYLSVNYTINFFIETNPNISKQVSGFSLISMLVFYTLNRFLFAEPKQNTVEDTDKDNNSVRKERALKRPKCAACGKK
jgi:hypothetical protein